MIAIAESAEMLAVLEHTIGGSKVEAARLPPGSKGVIADESVAVRRRGVTASLRCSSAPAAARRTDFATSGEPYRRELRASCYRQGAER